MSRQSQVSLFILMGAILIISISLIVFTNSLSQHNNTEIPTQNLAQKSFLNDCFEQTSSRIIGSFGLRGGDFESDSYVEGILGSHAYGVQDGTAVLPSDDETQSRIEAMLQQYLDQCDASKGEQHIEFSLQNVEVTLGEQYTNVKVIGSYNEGNDAAITD